MTNITVKPVNADELDLALQTLFQHQPVPERQASISRARTLLHFGELNPNGLLAARSADRLVGAMLVAPAAGTAGLVWPPQVVAGPNQGAIEDALVQAATAWLREQGVKVAQALLLPEEAELGRAIERNGFPRVTRLRFLRRTSTGLPSQQHAAAALTFESYEPKNWQPFALTLMQTYEDTLDCPELNGVRGPDEILAGHQAQGIFDPSRWWLIAERGNPVGVLLINEMPDWHSWEIVYMGLIPSARGRGLGRQLVLKALREARRAGVEQVTLSVDARNVFAQRIYDRLGFELWDQRDVYLAILTA